MSQQLLPNWSYKPLNVNGRFFLDTLYVQHCNQCLHGPFRFHIVHGETPYTHKRKRRKKQLDMYYCRITSWVQCTLGLDREVRGLCELIRKCVIELRDMREIWISDWSQSLCSAPRPSRPASPSGWIRSGTGSHGFLVSGTALSGAGWSVVSTL